MFVLWLGLRVVVWARRFRLGHWRLIEGVGCCVAIEDLERSQEMRSDDVVTIIYLSLQYRFKARGWGKCCQFAEKGLVASISRTRALRADTNTNVYLVKSCAVASQYKESWSSVVLADNDLLGTCC